MARKTRKTQPATDPDDVPPDYYIEMIGFSCDLQRLLEEKGYTNVQVKTEAGEPDCYSVNIRRTNNALDAVGVRQQLGQIVADIPATPKFHITWRVLQSVAIVQGDQVTAAIRVKSDLSKIMHASTISTTATGTRRR
jgi:hypothetical protein